MSKAWVLGFLLVAVAGCGGNTDDDGGQASGGKASGGTSSGGAGSGGISFGGTSSGGTSSGGSGGGKTCGGLAGLECESGEYCDYAGDCGGDDGQGVCTKKPSGCTLDYCPGVCGCDGKFYCYDCYAYVAGVDVSTSTACLPDNDAGVKKCGGSGGATCAAGEFCQFANGCGAPGSEGTCAKKPTACDTDCPGVCGCDGKFYCNACNANAAGTNASDDASCKKTDGGTQGTPCTSSSECNSGLLCCYPCGIPGCQNACIPPDPSGNCPLFP